MLGVSKEGKGANGGVENLRGWTSGTEKALWSGQICGRRRRREQKAENELD